MGRAEKKPEPVREEGAPEWMVTFSDCMTLLLTFFVLLLSFASFDDVGKFQHLGSVFAEQFSIDIETTREKESLRVRINPPQERQKGSEQPLLKEHEKENAIKEDRSVEHQQRKIFLMPSEKVFLGRGTVVSSAGKKTLLDMASFLKEMHNRIVVSENGHGENQSDELGLQRAWAVIDYLSREGKIDKRRISLSSAGIVMKEREDAGKMSRTLEVVLLEGSICN
jgi:chemotaxis protein MotB